MFKKLFLFSLIFFAFFFFSGNEVFGQASEHSEGCRLANQRLTPVDTKRCGDEISPSQSPKTIYVCTRRTQQGTGFSWSPTGSSCSRNEECNLGRCIAAAATHCSTKSVQIGTRAQTLPRTEIGGAVCFEFGGQARSFICRTDGTWSSGASCNPYSCCPDGSCEGPSGCSSGGNNGDTGTDNDTSTDGGRSTNGSNGSSRNGSAWTPGGGSPGSGGSPPQLEGIFELIYNGVKFFFGFIAIVAAAMVVYGAYMWMASGGDPQKTKMAQGVLTWAVIGLIFFMTFWFFFDFILGLFGIQLPTPGGTGLF